MSGPQSSQGISVRDDVSRYCKCILEIQLRRNFLAETLASSVMSPSQKIFYLEGACLQLRMIIELVAFASLVSSREAFSREHCRYSKEKDFLPLMRRLRKINPHFLPRGVMLRESEGDVVEEITEVDDQLDAQELIEAHGRMGNILHARNPFLKRPDYDQHRTILEEVLRRVNVTLRTHVAILSNGTYLLLKEDPNDGRFRTLSFHEAGA